MTHEDFITAFTSPSEADAADGHEKVFDNVREQLRRLGDKQQFEALFPVSVKKQWDAPAYDAAILLRELSPDCPITCEEAVRALLPSWDVSLEQVPFYLATRFGSEGVRETARKLEQGVATESEKSTLGTIIYWMNIYDEAYPKTR